MVLVVIRHRVKDYGAWRQVYNDFGPAQKAAGVTAESVYRDKDDPNTLLVLHSFATAADAEAFFNNAELRDAMERGGVEGQPRVEVYEEA